MIHRYIDLLEEEVAQYVPFIGTSGSNNYVGVLTADPGQDPTAITTPSANFSESPYLSPDGQWIAYTIAGGLNTVRPNGDDNSVIYNSSHPDWAGAAPEYVQWAPDSSHVIFALGVNDSVFTIPPEGGSVTTLYSDPSSRNVAHPQYNFDGSKITFAVELAASSHGVWVMDPDGTNASQLDTAPGSGVMTSSKPSETWMATQSRLTWNDGTSGSPVYKAMDHDGTDVVTLYSASDIIAPTLHSWLPDDSGYLAPSSLFSGAGDEIYLVDGAGGGSTLWATPSTNVGTANVFVYFDRAYFDSGDDILSFALDGTDERNEGSGTSHNLGLTG